MDAQKFVKACQEENPIDLYDVALGVFTTDLPEELFENYDVMMTIDLLANTLFEEKEFEKAEQLIEVLRSHQPELYQDCLFTLLPNLIEYFLFKGKKGRAEFYMEELSIAPEEDILMFVHLLDLTDAYGYSDMMDRIVMRVLNSDNHLDEEDHEILESYLIPVGAPSEYEPLIRLRDEFLYYADRHNIPSITAENIIDAMIDYLERNINEQVTDSIVLEENSFRNYIAGLLDMEYMDTYEYAAIILWGSVYLIDMMKEKRYLSPEDAEKCIEITRRVKAFFMVNIPWDGYWRLRFLHHWDRTRSIGENEFKAEQQLVLSNLPIRAKDIVNHSIMDIFGEKAKEISYARYLPEEQDVFEQMIREEDYEEFGADRKKDSMFPYFNYLSGEREDEFKPMPSGFCETREGEEGNECCRPDE